MKADPSKYSVSQALSACDMILTHVSGPSNPYNFSSDDIANLQGLRQILAADASAQTDAFNLLKARTLAKDNDLRSVSVALGRLGRIALASDASGTELQRIGFAHPAKPVRPTAIPAPTNVVASVFSETQTKLSFDRNGNSGTTTFEIFWSASGNEYQMVATTTRTSIVMDSQAPGVAAWFKIRAKRASLTSPMSGAVSVYAPSAPAAVHLRVA